MNKVDIYVNDFRLDLFNDEEISINLSVQNIQDISKTFTDFTQSFTVPATPNNNEIFAFYGNTNIDTSTVTTVARPLLWNTWSTIWNSNTTAWNISESNNTAPNDFDGRFRQPSQIEINSIPFRSGVIEIEEVQYKGTEVYAYTLTFYGELVTLSDLFGEDYLYDVDFSEFNHEYSDVAVRTRLTGDDDTGFFYPLCSPVKNWFYQSGTGGAANDVNNIAFNTGSGGQGSRGIRYTELKPALKVTNILTAIGAKYGITFTGSFLAATPFVDLSLWLHRFEGYLFSGGNDIAYQLINMNRNTGSGSQFNLATDTWTVVENKLYDLQVTMLNVSAPYELAVFRNGVFDFSVLIAAHPASSLTTNMAALSFAEGDTVQLFIRPQSNTSMTYQCTDYSGIDSDTAASEFSVDQTLGATYSLEVIVQDLMPEIKVKDFLSGILKAYNLVLVPSGTTFLLQPLYDWYEDGPEVNYQNEFDITEYAIGRPSLYREIEFKYQDTEQILGYQYQQSFGEGYGNLRSFLTFDGEEFIVELPFECPLFERLTDQATSAVTNVLVYKSITRETNEEGIFNPYLGAPILFYGYFNDYDISANPIGFVNADNTRTRINGAWYANTSNRYQSAGASRSITFGGDIDPYHLQTINRNLYFDYWQDYITDLYNKARRIFRIDAVLPLGKMATIKMNDVVIWNNTKYIINNVQLNLTTGKATFELLNVV
jgi:hypothetical protein